MSDAPLDAERRKAARARAEVRIFRQGEQEAEADALFWDRIPVDKRAEFVWQLSLELHALSNPEARYEPGLSRSVARVAPPLPSRLPSALNPPDGFQAQPQKHETPPRRIGRGFGCHAMSST